MGRDRAKEKLQAHKKARLERKEAKTEQKIKDLEIKKGHQNHKQQAAKNKGQKASLSSSSSSTKDPFSRGDDGDHAVSYGSADSGDNFNNNASRGNPKGGYAKKSFHNASGSSGAWKQSGSNNNKGGNVEGGDFGGVASEYPENSSGSTIKVPHIVYGGAGAGPGGGAVPKNKEGKGKNLSAQGFTACVNPNRGKIRPIWRLAIEDAANDKNKKRESTRNSSKPKLVEYSLQELLKASECRILKEVLNVSSIDEIPHEVAAVFLGRFDLVKKLLSDGYFMDCRMEGQDFTPMTCAIHLASWEMIQFLRDKNLGVHCKDKFQNTPLVKAVLRTDWTPQLMYDFWMMYKFDENTDLTSSNKAGVNFVHGLAYRGWHEVLSDVLQFMNQQKKLKSLVPALINSQIWNGYTALTIAVVAEHLDICETLLTHGASSFVEDKAGFTPLCHAISLTSRTPIQNDQQLIHPICLCLFSNMKQEEWNLKAFVAARFSTIPLTSLESIFVDLFYTVGRPLFSFIVRWIPGGAEMLIQSKMFTKLSLAGLRHFQRTDFIHSLCSIMFETLIYAEDKPAIVWQKFVKTFMEEGGADFCLKVLQRPQCDINDFIGTTNEENGKDKERYRQASSTASASDQPKSQDLSDVPESMGLLINSPPPNKNVGLAAVLPLMQVVDQSETFLWFEKNFPSISRCYMDLMSKGMLDFVMNVNLSPDHVDRTRQKALLFSNLMFREAWINPNDLMSGNYTLPSDEQNNKNTSNSNKSRKSKKVIKPLPKKVDIIPERAIFATRDKPQKEEVKIDAAAQNEERPHHTKPEEPGQAKPEESGLTKPEEPGQTKPEEPGQAKPEESGLNKPEEPGQTKPEEPGQTKPEEPCQTKPEEPGQTKPEEPCQTKPEEEAVEITEQKKLASLNVKKVVSKVSKGCSPEVDSCSIGGPSATKNAKRKSEMVSVSTYTEERYLRGDPLDIETTPATTVVTGNDKNDDTLEQKHVLQTDQEKDLSEEKQTTDSGDLLAACTDSPHVDDNAEKVLIISTESPADLKNVLQETQNESGEINDSSDCDEETFSSAIIISSIKPKNFHNSKKPTPVTYSAVNFRDKNLPFVMKSYDVDSDIDKNKTSGGVSVITDSNCQTVLHPMTIRAQNSKVEENSDSDMDPGSSDGKKKKKVKLASTWLPSGKNDSESTKRHTVKTSVISRTSPEPPLWRKPTITQKRNKGMMFRPIETISASSIVKSEEKSVQKVVTSEVRPTEQNATLNGISETSEDKPSNEVPTDASDDYVVNRGKTYRNVRVQTIVHGPTCPTD